MTKVELVSYKDVPGATRKSSFTLQTALRDWQDGSVGKDPKLDDVSSTPRIYKTEEGN